MVRGLQPKRQQDIIVRTCFLTHAVFLAPAQPMASALFTLSFIVALQCNCPQSFDSMGSLATINSSRNNLSDSGLTEEPVVFYDASLNAKINREPRVYHTPSSVNQGLLLLTANWTNAFRATNRAIAAVTNPANTPTFPHRMPNPVPTVASIVRKITPVIV